MNPLWLIGYIRNVAPSDVFVLLVLFGGFYTAFWIWMIADCALNERPDCHLRLLWLLVILFVPFGSVIYYFVRKRSRGEVESVPEVLRSTQWVACPHCGASVEESTRKCPVCGERLRPLGSVSSDD